MLSLNVATQAESEFSVATFVAWPLLREAVDGKRARVILRRCLLPGFIVLCALLGGTSRADAEPSADDKALATLLFQEGRALLADGRIADACQKLAESQRLDPGGGTLLNLALCHEQEGRLARSWGEFKEAALMARRDGRRDREIEAANHVSALEPRLSRLTIVVPAPTQVQGLLIERDGREIGPGAWSTAIPVDGGEHVVKATALGREPFVATVVIASESDARTIEIPVLATPVVMVTPPRVSSPQLAGTPVAPTFTPPRLRWAGIGAAGVGLALLGGAGYALATAISTNDASKNHCFVDGCDDIGLQKRHDATFRGNVATVLGVSGILLVGAGATLFHLGARSNVGSDSAQRSIGFILDAAPSVVVGGIGGDF